MQRLPTAVPGHCRYAEVPSGTHQQPAASHDLVVSAFVQNMDQVEGATRALRADAREMRRGRKRMAVRRLAMRMKFGKDNVLLLKSFISNVVFVFF